MPRVEPGGIVRFAGGFCLENATPDPMIVESDPYTMTIRVSRPPEVTRALNAQETRELMDRIEMMQRQAEEHRRREAEHRAQTGISEGGLVADALQMYRNAGALARGTVVNAPNRHVQWSQLNDPMTFEPPQPTVVSPDMLARLRAILAGAGAGPVDPVRLDAGAHRRARILLLRHLNLKQRRSFKEHGSFTVRGNRTGGRYIIQNNGRVIRRDDNHEFCLQVVGEPVPFEDAILARKILIESDEQLFLGTANDLTAQRDCPPATLFEVNELERARYHAERELRQERERRQAELNALSSQYDLRPPLEAPNARWRAWWRTR